MKSSVTPRAFLLLAGCLLAGRPACSRNHDRTRGRNEPARPIRSMPDAGIAGQPDAARRPIESTPPRGTPVRKERPDNQVPPDPTSLRILGERLLQALSSGTTNDQAAAACFFPPGPFVPLKQARNPAGYWRFLWRRFLRDLARLRRRSWKGARFLRWEAPSPTWVRPGREHNRIGYYRLRRAQLWYERKGRRLSLQVDTLITWQGRWYVIHLLPLKR